MDNTQKKNHIRSLLRSRLQKQKEVERLKKSFYIKEKLFDLVEFIHAKTILFYLSFNGEVETQRMIEKAISLGKKVAAPFIDRRNKKLLPALIDDCGLSLVMGPYGICEPRHRRIVPTNTIDLIIVPALAFDVRGNRIGRGKGYYDRFLYALSRPIPTVGLAFNFQVSAQLTCLDSHDFRVDRVLYA